MLSHISKAPNGLSAPNNPSCPVLSIMKRDLTRYSLGVYSFLLKRLFSQLFFFSGSGRAVEGKLLLGGAAKSVSPLPPPRAMGFLWPPGGCTGPPPP